MKNNEDDVVKLGIITVLGIMAILLHQHFISLNVYEVNRILIREVVLLHGEIKRLNQDFAPVIYFLEQVNEHQKRLLEKQED